jgi:hypothetical protein
MNAMNAPIADPNELLLTVLCVGVGGTVLALVGMWLEIRWGRRAIRGFSGVLFLLLWALAAILWKAGQPSGVVGSLLALGVACLAAFAVQVAFIRGWVIRLLQPRAIWTILLVVSPIFAVVYAQHVNRPEELPACLSEAGLGIHKDTTGARAVTDVGREIMLFHYADLHSPRAVEDSLLEADRFTHEVIRIERPSATSNCHGWVFAGGAFGIPSEQVDTVLADNGYLPVEHALAGDLVIHRDDTGKPQHTGIVRFVEERDGLVIVESKWGPLGVFLHTPENQPYGRHFDFWRSRRRGHELEILPKTAANP